MTFDISEAEQTQSPLLNDTIPGSAEIKEEIAFKENKATQTSFTSAAEVSRGEEKSCVVDLEPEDLVNDDKSEQEEANKKEESVEKDKDEPDEAQGGQDIEIAEHALEEVKTNGETKELESGLTHQENALEEDQLEDETTENEKANAEEMLDNSGTHTEPEMSKVQLEDDQQDRDKEQEPEEQHIESLKSDQSIHLKTSEGSKELEEEEETVLGSSTTFDAKLVSEEPTMEETVVSSEDVKGSPTTQLNADVVESKLDVLDILGTVETIFHDKEQKMKSKVKAQKVLDA